jgi:MoaA/NifB/PqqE/SkfB family radical SAM enzyme
MNKISCFYSLGGINYKNGFVTSCPQQSDRLFEIESGQTILPSEIINSKGFKDHRKEMMTGTWSQGCHLCKEVEEAKAGESMRKSLWFMGPDFTTVDLEGNYKEDGSIDFSNLRHIELRFSNACNMACLHCSTVYSSGWMSKLKNYQTTDEDKFYRLHQLTKEMHGVNGVTTSIDLDNDQVEDIVKDLNKHFLSLEKVDFAGGEVLYQKQFFHCLNFLKDHPNAKNMDITFHSNFNVDFDPEKLSNLLSNFKSSRIMISIDAGKNIYPYFRTGNWDKLTDNLRKFREINDFTQVCAVCTTSIYQMMDIENIFESFLTLDFDWINSSIVYTPRYLNPSLIMFQYKDEIMQDIFSVEQYIKKTYFDRIKNFETTEKLRSWSPDHKVFNDIRSSWIAIQNIKNYVVNTSLDYKNYKSFLKYVEKTDVIWKQNFNDHFKKFKFVDGKIERITHND